LLFILEKFNVSESAYRELTVFCDGLPRKYLVSQCREDINSLYHFERIQENIPGAYVSKSSVITEEAKTTKFEILLTFDPSPEILICILSVSGFT
jgi:hypothetical protein